MIFGSRKWHFGRRSRRGFLFGAEMDIFCQVAAFLNFRNGVFVAGVHEVRDFRTIFLVDGIDIVDRVVVDSTHIVDHNRDALGVAGFGDTIDIVEFGAVFFGVCDFGGDISTILCGFGARYQGDEGIFIQGSGVAERGDCRICPGGQVGDFECRAAEEGTGIVWIIKV